MIQNIDLKNSIKDKLLITLYDLNVSEIPNEPLHFQNTFKKLQKNCLLLPKFAK